MRALVFARGVGAVLSFLLLSGSASAAPPAPAKPAVLVLSFGADDNASVQAGQVGANIESVVQQSSSFVLADAQSKFDPTGVQQRKDALQKGDEALNFGIKSYVNLDEGLGLESFERAITAYEESPLWVEENFHKLTKALVMRILVKWAEDPVSTRKELRRVLTMDPKVEFPKEWTPPDLALEAQHIREQVPYEVKVSLDVSTEPVPAKVYIDGIYRGVAPMSVKELNPGEHYLSLVASGYEVVQRIVKAEPGATLTETLKPTSRGQALINFTTQIRQHFRQQVEIDRAKFLGATTGAQQVIVARVTRATGRLAIQFHRIAVRDGSVLQEVQLNDLPDSDREFRQTVQTGVETLLGNDCHRDDGKACPFKQLLPPLPKIPWSTVKAATGITAGVLFTTGVIMGIVARSKDADFQKLPQTDPTLPSVGATVRSEAVAADVLMGLGLAGGVAWGYMQFGLPYMQRTEMKDAPVLEKDRAPEKKEPEKKKPDEDDPFASSSDAPSSTPLLSRLPTLFAAPQASGWTFGLQGAF